jgi:uncharacterized protein (TIGR02001 family)
MRGVIGAALLASGAISPTAAHAEGAFSGNIALTSDYVFRGYSQTMEDPAVQGGFDYASEVFYSGVWASNVDFGVPGSIEIDLYAGVTPTLGPVQFDFGVTGFFYPGSTDAWGEFDFWEVKGAGAIAPVEALTLGAEANFSPDFTTNGGQAWYVEANADYAVTPIFSLSGALGNQSVETANYYAGSTDNYTAWHVGGTFALYGFSFDVRYHDTDLDMAVTDERVVATLRREL